MIAAWMLYTVAVTLLLLAAASAAEYVARAARKPTRTVWAVAMIVALGLSVRALITGLNTRSATVPSVSTATVRAGVGTLEGTGFTAGPSPRDKSRVSACSRCFSRHHVCTPCARSSS